MTQEQEQRAREIFSRTQSNWSREDERFLGSLMKERDRLKQIRAEVQGE